MVDKNEAKETEVKEVKEVNTEGVINADLALMLRGIGTMATLDVGRKFAYALQKNKKIITDELEVIQAALKQLEGAELEGMVAFEASRESLLNNFGKKTKDGALETDPISQQVTLENIEGFEAGFKKLQVKHKATLDAQKALDTINEEIMKSPITIDLYKMDLDTVPETLTNRNMSIIFPLINEEE